MRGQRHPAASCAWRGADNNTTITTLKLRGHCTRVPSRRTVTLKFAADLGKGTEAASKAEAQLAAINHPMQPSECEFHENEAYQNKITLWTRPGLGRFDENLPNGTIQTFIAKDRYEQDGKNGTIVFDSSRNMEVLLPDKENTTAKPAWRRPGETQWKLLGEMRNAK